MKIVPSTLWTRFNLGRLASNNIFPLRINSIQNFPDVFPASQNEHLNYCEDCITKLYIIEQIYMAENEAFC